MVWLVAVQPGGNAQALVLRLRITFHHAEGGREPAGLAEGAGHQEHVPGFLELGVRPAGHPGAEVRRLHRARSAARDHQLSVLGEGLADVGDAAVGRIRAEHRVTAHHAHHIVRIPVLEEAVKGVADGVVMQGPGECDRQVTAAFSVGDKVGEDVAVVAVGIAAFVVRIELVVERFRVVKFASDLIIVHISFCYWCEFTKNGAIFPRFSDFSIIQNKSLKISI